MTYEPRFTIIIMIIGYKLRVNDTIADVDGHSTIEVRSSERQSAGRPINRTRKKNGAGRYSCTLKILKLLVHWIWRLNGPRGKKNRTPAVTNDYFVSVKYIMKSFVYGYEF
ncbi:uncharacterized protein LOC111040134 [Myzus persicae]|uniref:uncharacterized protein LOC111040134 n=1 Tax=Myzus persicae TaxID=13164 RepID=UPI000B93934A|nr:uncharacterized protein LOC111040134 [Myzus persicae]